MLVNLKKKIGPVQMNLPKGLTLLKRITLKPPNHDF